MSLNGDASGGCHAERERLPHRLLRWSYIYGSILREADERTRLQLEALHHLPPSQLRLLQLLVAAGPLRVGETAVRLGISVAATSKSLDGLERRGLVSRRRLAGDRRATRVTATAAGHRLVRTYLDHALAGVDELMVELGHRGVDELCTLLERACLNLLESGRPDSTSCARCAGLADPDCPLAERRGSCPLRPEAAGARDDAVAAATPPGGGP